MCAATAIAPKDAPVTNAVRAMGETLRTTVASTSRPGSNVRQIERTIVQAEHPAPAFVKPAHFDLPTLKPLQPAAFIAQPVLKVMDPAVFPRRETLGAAYRRLDPNAARGFFLYGGYGDARPVSPPGVRFSPIWGARGMLEGSAKVTLGEDDFAFLRPTESEGVFLQFGDIAVYDGADIVDWWPTFPVHA